MYNICTENFNEKKILYYCTTPFQIMIAISFKLTILKDSVVELVYTDHITEVEGISDNIENSNCFERVICYDGVERDAEYCTLRGLLFSQQDVKRRLGRDCNYDYFFFTDILGSSNEIFNVLYNNNNEVKAVYVEEGVISTVIDVNNQFGKSRKGKEKIIRRILKQIIGTRELYGHIDMGFSIEKAEYYFPIYNMKQALNISSTFIELINNIFRYDVIKEEIKNYKYVFLEDIDYAFGKERKGINQRIISDIIHIINKEELIIKRHPRNSDDVYEDGINFFSSSFFPWELLALNGGTINKVIISGGTGAVLYPSLYFGVKQETIVLSNCRDYSPDIDTDYYRMFNSICGNTEGIILPKDKNELLKVIITR